MLWPWPSACPCKSGSTLQKLGRKYGKLGGKKSARNITAEERSARAKKASDAAARKRTAERLERERLARRARRED